MLRPEDEPATTTVDLGPAKEIQHTDDFPKPAQASPVQKEKKKLQFHMSSKIQIIPDNRQGQLNTGFLGTIPGVLKIAEIILAFVAFVLAICADRRSTTAAWTEHITFETMIVVCALLAGYVCFPHLTIREEPTREGLIVVGLRRLEGVSSFRERSYNPQQDFLLQELIFYGINTLFYFISIWLMVHLSASWGTDGRGAAIMTAILCVALTIIFGIETFLKLKAWRGENEPSSKVITTGAQPSQS
ncbi:synaptophysin / synaptoporin [Ancylostoma caninum]|uniref:Synaptophysin / synaptoporin n=1 Tax=Ancylostoma caninum TaxID=29170 RepID=A0A368FZB8_ANCCA|nr:synaptophysin / synaptoporin [Ancylostoma caninum]